MSMSNREKLRYQNTNPNSKKNFLKWTLITIIIVAVIGGFSFAIIKAQQSKNPDYSEVVQPAVVKDKGIIVGKDRKIVESTPTGQSNVTIYQDYLCPGCKSFEESFSPEIDKILDEEVGTIEYRTVGMLDSMSAGTNYSSRSANVAMCSAVNNPDKFYDVNKLFYANQPAEGSAGLKNAELTKLATSVGTGDIEDCVSKGTYRGFVKQVTDYALNEEKIQGTPTVLINGKPYELGGAKGLYDSVVEANKTLKK